MSDEDMHWLTTLAMRDNVMLNEVPYIPILVEDILSYVNLIDYESSCIKTIQTIGEIIPKPPRAAMLMTLTPNISAECPVSFKSLSIKDVYQKTSQEIYSVTWEKNRIFKILGNLEELETGIVLNVDYLIDVEDVEDSYETLSLLSKIARREYHQYYNALDSTEIIKLQWEKMKNLNE